MTEPLPFLSRAIDECSRKLGTEELDRRLATEVFGWMRVDNVVTSWSPAHTRALRSSVPRFTRDLTEIAQAMARRWSKLQLKVEVNAREVLVHATAEAYDGRHLSAAAWSDTEAKARCIAAAMLHEREKGISA